MIECAYCGGEFDHADMDGDHCRGCAAELYAEEESCDECQLPLSVCDCCDICFCFNCMCDEEEP